MASKVSVTLRAKGRLYYALCALLPLGALLLAVAGGTALVAQLAANVSSPRRSIPAIDVEGPIERTCARYSRTGSADQRPGGAEADRIVATQDEDSYPVARRVYEAALIIDPGDNCAALGLRELARLEAEAGRQRAWLEYWAAVLRQNIDEYLIPLGTMLGAAAGAFVVLLVAARALTRAVVETTTKAPLRFRNWSWMAGAVLAVVACLLATGALSVAAPVAPPGFAVLLAVVGFVGMALGWLALVVVESARKRGWRRVVAVAVPASSIALGGIIATGFSTASPSAIRAGCLIASLGLAVVGVAWIAFARGTRLAVEVAATSGDVTRELVLAKLAELGSSPPRHIRTPDASDTEALPSGVLSEVPSGGWAAVLFKAWELVRPGVPWKVSFTSHGTTAASWVITRNGMPAQEGRTLFRSSQLLLDDASDKPRAEDFATACASETLTTMANAHIELAVGINGVKRWQSLAYHAIAVGTPPSARRHRLLRAAVEASPDFALPRMLLVNDLDQTTMKNRLRHLNALEELYVSIFPALTGTPYSAPLRRVRSFVAPGMEPTQIRLLHTIAAAHFHRWLDLRDSACVDAGLVKGAWLRSGAALLELEEWVTGWRRIDRRQTPDLSQLLESAREPLIFLALDLLQHDEAPPVTDRSIVARRKELVGRLSRLGQRWPAPVGDEGLTVISDRGRYARACYRARRGDAVEQWREDLRLSCRDDRRRRWAQIDPSFRRFQTVPPDDRDAAERQEYKLIVGDPPLVSFSDLEVFKPYATSLREAGILDLEQLRLIPADRLARRLRVDHTLVHRWQDLAELGCRITATGHPSSLDVLELLNRVGVRTLWQLRMAMKTPDELYRNLVEQAASLQLVPTHAETIEAWSAGDFRQRYWRSIRTMVAGR